MTSSAIRAITTGLLIIFSSLRVTCAIDYHVAVTGDNSADGSLSHPFRTINFAATRAQSGDVVTVHAGTYRERVDPPNSGVTFEAAAGDNVTISGAEPVTQWTPAGNGTWTLKLPSMATFGNFNPYMDRIFGDWFGDEGRVHHTGSVYLGSVWLDEASSLKEVLMPLAPGAAPQWFGTVDGDMGQYLVNLLWIAPRGGAVVSAGSPSWRYGSQPYNTSAGLCASYIMGGNVLRFDNVDFGSGASALDLSAAADAAAGAGAALEVRLGDRWGSLLGTAAIAPTGGWEAWQNFSVPITPTAGLQNISLVFLPPGYAAGNTTLFAQVPAGVDPNAVSEIHVRQTVFYPSSSYVDNITVRGFTLERAATQWAPPSSEQVGIIGTHWSKGWIIESNEVRYSRCSCVSLGKYGDGFDNTNTRGQADPYTACVYRALANGWHKDRVGSHTVRNNHIHHCGQTGVVGSLGGAFSSVEGNDIHDCNWGQTFSGAEMSCIKLHAAVDVVIKDNHLRNCSSYGIWLDWMAQGTMVLSNLIHDTRQCGIFSEVDHGPATIANNIFLAPSGGICHDSAGNAYAHNLVSGTVENHGPDSRNTPALVPHETDIAAVIRAVNGDHRMYNNLMTGTSGWAPFDSDFLPCFGSGNVYTGPSTCGPSTFETNAFVNKSFDAGATLTEEGGAWFLQLNLDPSWASQQRALVTTALLGTANLTRQPFTMPDGSALQLSEDYFGKPRDLSNPFPGPIENTGSSRVQVWPKT
jgi:alpha-N-arabinofuranosidase